MTEKVTRNLNGEPEPVLTIESLKLGRLLGSGGNNNAYEIAGSSKFIARVFRTKWHGNLPMITELMLAHETVPEGVQLARIASVGTLADGRAIAIMERAAGSAVHNRHARYQEWHDQIVHLTKIDPNHYLKLIEDQDTLFGYGLTVDPSKPDNIFYDPAFGFTFIDLSTNSDGLEVPYSLVTPILNTGAIYNGLRGKLQPEDRENITQIIELLRSAGDHIDEDYVERMMRVASDTESD